jgi:enamine deaminase RidA (YjgF/YER057c/UK114 family)
MTRTNEVLTKLGIVLPPSSTPRANYLSSIQTGQLLFVSGQLCLNAEGSLVAIGKVGTQVSLVEGQAAARACALNILSVAQSAIGSLDNIARVVRLGGFVNAAPDFADVSAVINGASDLMVDIFGERGSHARTSVGVATLPSCAAVEIEAVFEIE